MNNPFMFFESKIASSSKDIEFLTGCFTKNFSTFLLFRGSDDGFSAKTFHEKCDNKGPTLSIIRSE